MFLPRVLQMLRFSCIASLLFSLLIALADADYTHSRGPNTIATSMGGAKPADFWCGTYWVAKVVW